MHEFDDAVLQCFLKNQGQLFPEGDVVSNLEEAVQLREADMKLPKKFVEQVADQWNRKNVKTAEQAFNTIANEQKKVEQAKQGNPKKSGRRGSGYVEQKPKWFNEDNTAKPSTEADFDIEEKHKEIMKKLVKEVMENTYKLEVPLEVEISMGNNWYEAK